MLRCWTESPAATGESCLAQKPESSLLLMLFLSLSCLSVSEAKLACSVFVQVLSSHSSVSSALLDLAAFKAR